MYNEDNNSKTFYAVCGLVDTLRDELREEMHKDYGKQLEHLYAENKSLKYEIMELNRVCRELSRYERAYRAIEGLHAA